jgi:ribose-phosphate pyrophosphokinase
MKILTGNSNRPLAEAISAKLALPLVKANVRRFSDNEIFVEILENVRGEDMFVLQSTSFPANDHLMELLITIDALRRSSARRITAVMPYFGYARQDRRTGPRTPISAKLVANLLTHAGASRVLTLDLHAAQIQASSTFRSTTCSPGRCSARTSRTRSATASSPWCRPTSAAWSARGRSPSGLTPISPSSISAANRPASARS